MDLQLTANSPTGHGEQVYVFLAASPTLDQIARSDAPRRIAGAGVLANVANPDIHRISASAF
jgi:hypothetical protein